MRTKKDRRITLRLTPEQYESIRAKAETAQMSTGAYVRAAALRHRVVVIDGLPELTHEPRVLAAVSTSWRCCATWGSSGRSTWERPGRPWERPGRPWGRSMASSGN